MISSEPIESSHALAEPAVDTLPRAGSRGGDAVRQRVAEAGELPQRGVEQWRGQARAWRDGASAHIRTHPIRSVAIAASTGVLLAWLARALSR